MTIKTDSVINVFKNTKADNALFIDVKLTDEIEQRIIIKEIV